LGGNQKELMAAVKRWLESQFDGEWTNKGRSLPIGCQLDSYSCAICAINAIAHAVFGDQLWEQKRASCERATWFTTLVKNHLDQVCNNF
jgi:hypothetical protein